WVRALQEFRTAEKIAPRMPGIRFDIALVYYRQRDYHAAIAPFESVIRDQPDFPQAKHLLGICYISDERFREAAATLETLWASLTTDESYLYVLVVAAGNAGRHDLEERALDRLLEIGQQSAALHLTVGKAYLSRGQDERALGEFEKAAAS